VVIFRCARRDRIRIGSGQIAGCRVGSPKKPPLLLQASLWSAVLEMHKPVPVKGYGKGGITHL
jgi:hypothetical protein